MLIVLEHKHDELPFEVGICILCRNVNTSNMQPPIHLLSFTVIYTHVCLPVVPGLTSRIFSHFRPLFDDHHSPPPPTEKILVLKDPYDPMLQYVVHIFHFLQVHCWTINYNAYGTYYTETSGGYGGNICIRIAGLDRKN